ncbi:MAG TPA: HAMP domain-containing protein, partial [Dissulfurispiraceae bacterium]|nr:HAMP domain-containing protein [Dissulfurispiraceae bacterium]
MQRKILIVLILNIIIVSVTLSVVSYITIHESIDRSLQNRLALARVISNYVEALINRSLNRLQDIARSENVDLTEKDPASKKRMLETAYRYSLFTDGVFLLDKHGNKLMAYPSDIEQFFNLTYIPSVNQVLQSGKSVVSDIYTIAPINKKVVFIMTPLKDRKGHVTGIAGGLLSPASDVLQNLLKTAVSEPNTYIDIIDSNEMVVASDNPSHIFQHHDHGSTIGRMIKEGRSGIIECKHGFSHPNATEKPTDLLAVVPFRTATWGIVLGQAEKDVFAPAMALQSEFVTLVLVFAIASLVLSVIMSKKIVKPLTSLTNSANRIASGDLDTPVGNVGSDEILKLSTSFDAMRGRLADSLEKIKIHNVELETRVAIRTQEIRDSRKRVRHLLKKAISSQEEERRRIARELHDTILQEASAFLIQLDICRMHPELISVNKIDEMKAIAVGIIDGIHRVIDDLRPSLLDDLGIDAAIMWLLKKHLSEKGIHFYLDFKSPLTRKLPQEVEILVFRILQEALVNIARHAKAGNVFISAEVNESSLVITVEDDGVGFDINELLTIPIESGRGLGLMGMKERAK